MDLPCSLLLEVYRLHFGLGNRGLRPAPAAPAADPANPSGGLACKTPVHHPWRAARESGSFHHPGPLQALGPLRRGLPAIDRPEHALNSGIYQIGAAPSKGQPGGSPEGAGTSSPLTRPLPAHRQPQLRTASLVRGPAEACAKTPTSGPRPQPEPVLILSGAHSTDGLLPVPQSHEARGAEVSIAVLEVDRQTLLLWRGGVAATSS